MKRAIAVVSLMFAMGTAMAQTTPTANHDDHTAAASVGCEVAGGDARDQDAGSSGHRDGAYVAPCGAKAASSAATGTLTPVYIGAGVAAAATIAGALSGGGHNHSDTPAGTGGTGGTTGTTGTVGAH